jgi:spermidine/putrescine transport system substrate-binding protein
MIGMVVSAIGLFLYVPRLVHSFFGDNTITVLAWPQVIDATALNEFEKSTGIKVYIRYFESNEELMVKLETTGGEGYDLIMPGDYAAARLIDKKLLKKLDKSKLDFWSNLYPTLLGHYFDAENDYTIPYYWGVYGLGVDADYFAHQSLQPSWSLLFEKPASSCVGMIDGSREITLIAGYYLFGKTTGFTHDEMQQIKKLLIKQKEWVQVYSDLRGDYLLASKTCPVVLLLSADIARIMPYFNHIDFLLPEEGSFVIIDSFGISASSQKEELVYQFLNYMYRQDILQHYVHKFGFFPVTTNVQSTFKHAEYAVPTPELFSRLHFFKNVIPEKVLNDIWITLKA